MIIDKNTFGVEKNRLIAVKTSLEPVITSEHLLMLISVYDSKYNNVVFKTFLVKSVFKF